MTGTRGPEDRDLLEITSASGTALPFRINVAGREMHVYQLSESELDSLAEAHSSDNVGLCGIAIGACLSLGTTLLTVTIDDAKTFASFVSLTALSFVLALFFGIRAWTDRSRNRKIVARVKRESKRNSQD